MAGGDVHTVTIGTVATATVVTTITIATPTRAADCLDISNTAPAALSGGSWISVFPLSLSRWHGIADSTTVGGDVHTVIAAATVTAATAITITATADTATSVTTNRAAECCGVSGTAPAALSVGRGRVLSLAPAKPQAAGTALSTARRLAATSAPSPMIPPPSPLPSPPPSTPSPPATPPTVAPLVTPHRRR